jgi:hypothetical protein
MVNNYDLEWELLNKSKVTNRAPMSIVDTPSAEYATDSGTNYNKKQEEDVENS